jgi:hypothetical protein
MVGASPRLRIWGVRSSNLFGRAINLLKNMAYYKGIGLIAVDKIRNVATRSPRDGSLLRRLRLQPRPLTESYVRFTRKQTSFGTNLMFANDRFCCKSRWRVL